MTLGLKAIFNMSLRSACLIDGGFFFFLVKAKVLVLELLSSSDKLLGFQNCWALD